VEVGKEVKDFKLGDRVAALMPVMGSQWGAAAEFAVVKASFLGKIGKLTSFESAVLVPLVSLTAVTALEKIKEPQGKRILIHAGSGGVGTFASQYAKHVLGMYVAMMISKQVFAWQNRWHCRKWRARNTLLRNGPAVEVVVTVKHK
jgi:alcohol dehydrogenase